MILLLLTKKIFKKTLNLILNNILIKSKKYESTEDAISRYFKKVKINGIIQVGANYGQEVNLFQNFTSNIMLFEPIPKIVDFLKQKHPNVIIFSFALGANDEIMTLNLASNNGESSSLLKPTGHKKIYPSITFEETIEVPVRKFSTIVKEYEINMNEYNILLIDTQGFDLQVLKGFEDYLLNIDIIFLEYINFELYQNDSNLLLIKKYLGKYNFKLKEKFDENYGSGNAVFVRSN